MATRQAPWLTADGLETLVPRVARAVASNIQTGDYLEANHIIASPQRVRAAIMACAVRQTQWGIEWKARGVDARIPYVLAKLISDAIDDELGCPVRFTMT